MKEETKDYGSIKTDKAELIPDNGGERFGFRSLFDTRVMRKHSFIMQVLRAESQKGEKFLRAESNLSTGSSTGWSSHCPTTA